MSDHTTQNCAGLVTTTIHAMLNAKNPALAAAYRTTFRDSGSNDMESQMREQNAFWRLELGLCPGKSCLDARHALEDGVAYPIWLQQFQNHVLPVIVKAPLRFRPS